MGLMLFPIHETHHEAEFCHQTSRIVVHHILNRDLAEGIKVDLAGFSGTDMFAIHRGC